MSATKGLYNMQVEALLSSFSGRLHCKELKPEFQRYLLDPLAQPLLNCNWLQLTALKPNNLLQKPHVENVMLKQNFLNALQHQTVVSEPPEP